MLKQGVAFLSTHAKKTLFYGHIYSHLCYCISLWGPVIQQAQIRKLQKLQNKCVQLIDMTWSDLTTKYRENRILKVPEMIDLQLAKIGYKLLKKELLKRILEIISTDPSSKSLTKTHNYGTRYKSVQNVPHVLNKKYSNSFLCRTVQTIQPLLLITNELRNLLVIRTNIYLHLLLFITLVLSVEATY